MDSYRANLVRHEPADRGVHDDAPPGAHFAGDDDFAREPPPVSVGQDERRMQVRAYNYWASLLGDRLVPQIADLMRAPLPDFADHAVMLDFSQGLSNPAVTMLGKKLAQECDIDTAIAQLRDVPAGSLLSRITDRYDQILANAAPIGFEAEFVNQRGTTLLYRGILLPFSGNGEAVAHVMGVINWKELADPIVTAQLRRELETEVATAQPPGSSRLSAWADGPVATVPGETDDLASVGLAGARAAAAAAGELAQRSRAALSMAIGRAWDLALAAQAEPLAWREMTRAAGMAAQPRASLAAVVRLVFGTECHQAQLAEIALALAYAQRLGLGRGALAELLAGTPDGLRGIVRQERRLRRTTWAA